jgi:hypothetical protein
MAWQFLLAIDNYQFLIDSQPYTDPALKAEQIEKQQ